jgi:hypothetical protein
MTDLTAIDILIDPDKTMLERARAETQMDRGANAWMVDAVPPFKQRLRAAGTVQRKLYRGGYDPLDTEAPGEGSMNLTTNKLDDLVLLLVPLSEVLAKARGGPALPE